MVTNTNNNSPLRGENNKNNNKLLSTIITIIFTILSVSILSYALTKHVDYHKAWLPINQIALSYENPVSITNGDYQIDPDYINLTLHDVVSKGSITTLPITTHF